MRAGRRFFCIVLIIVAGLHPSALFAQAPVETPSCPALDHPTIALVLSGGSALGMAHIGVLKVLEKAGIPIDMIVGTSMGAIVAGMYAAGYSPDEMEKIVGTADWYSIIADTTSSFSSFYDREKCRQAILPISFNAQGFRLARGLFTGSGALALFKKITAHIAHIRNFDELPMPYRAVATDILRGEKVVLSSGSLAEAMRASMSMPSLFFPYTIDGKALVDGGIVDNLPVDIARNAGADIVIAVESRAGLAKNPQHLNSFISVANQTFGIFIEQNMQASRKDADFLIVTDMRGFSSLDYHASATLIARGEEYAASQMELLRAFADRIALVRPLVKPEEQKNRLAKPAAPDTSVAVAPDASAAPDTSAAPDAAAAAANEPVQRPASLPASHPVTAQPETPAMHALHIGMDSRMLIANTLSSYVNISPALILRNLSSKGSAFYAEISLVNALKAYVDYYQPFGVLYIKPWARYSLEYDSYDFDENAFHIGFMYRSAGAGLWLGVSPSVAMNFAAGYSFENVRSGTMAALNIGEFKFASIYDSRDRLVFPSKGCSLAFLGRWAHPAFGSDIEMIRGDIEASAFFTIVPRLNLGIRAYAGSDFSAINEDAKPLLSAWYFNLRRPGMFYGHPAHSERLEGNAALAASLELRYSIAPLHSLLGGEWYALLNFSIGGVRVDDGSAIDFLPLRSSCALGTGLRITDTLGILVAFCLNHDAGSPRPLSPALTIELGSFSSNFEMRR